MDGFERYLAGAKALYSRQNGGKIPFDEWYKTVPKYKNDTISYNLRRAYELAPQKELDAFVNTDAHLKSAYKQPDGTYQFVKRKDHPTVQYEIDWYNSPDAAEFREQYNLDDSSDYYKYIPKKAMGGNISKMGYRDDSPYRNRESIEIDTPTGQIDMSNTGIPLMANGRYLAPYSGMHQFNTNKVTETPIKQNGGWLDSYDEGGHVHPHEDSRYSLPTYSSSVGSEAPRASINTPTEKPRFETEQERFLRENAEAIRFNTPAAGTATPMVGIDDPILNIATGGAAAFMKGSLKGVAGLALEEATMGASNMGKLGYQVGKAGLKGAKRAADSGSQAYKDYLKKPLRKDLEPEQIKKTIPKGKDTKIMDSFLSQPTPNHINVNKSEIDWGKWNKEIPTNKDLMVEYRNIEASAKADGTWMKNADGTEFKGTPEQFIQQNSKNFKKAFPEGFNKTYRGDDTLKPELKKTEGEIDYRRYGNTAFFGADKKLADSYAGIDNMGFRKSKPYTPYSVSNEGGVYHLAYPKSDKSLSIYANKADWQEVPIEGPDDMVRDMERSLKSTKKIYKNNPENLWYIKDSIDEIEQRLKYLKNNKNKFSTKEELLDLKKNSTNTLNPDKVFTDDIAEYIEKEKVPYVRLEQVDDSGLGDVDIFNHTKGRYAKSLYGNNGMFDMNNPNIYKAVTGIATAGALGASATEQKNGGWLDTY